MEWSKERWQEVARAQLGRARFVVLANREPYVHVHDGHGVRCDRPIPGLTTALDSLLSASGGTWVAHGSGDADRITCDAAGRLQVPPENPRYSLRRVWLDKKEEFGYSYGFANQGLWALCNVAYAKPRFDASDWEHYKRVNRIFADSVLEEIDGVQAVVFTQDYHLALAPRFLREASRDLVLMQSWHVPWPNCELFRQCPWQKEILDGLLGNDLLSFHNQSYCSEFLATVSRTLDAKVDAEKGSVTYAGKTTFVRTQPLSFDAERELTKPAFDGAGEERRWRKRLRIKTQRIIVAVDRADQMKEIPERVRAVDYVLTHYPEWRAKFSLIQVLVPSRVPITAHRHLNQELETLIRAVNYQFGDDAWEPITYIKENFSAEQLLSLYRVADACVVSSAHEGINVPGKEFIVARSDDRGVLIVPRSAVQDSGDALIVNPVAADEIAEIFVQALSMPVQDQEARMRNMRQQLSDSNNVYRWAGLLLSEAGKLFGGKKRKTLTAVG